VSKLAEFMTQQGKEMKDTKKEKPAAEFSKMSANEKWVLVEKLLRDLEYID